MDEKRFKILMTISEAMIARNLLYAGVVAHLIKEGCEVHIVVSKQKMEFYKSEFPLEHLYFIEHPGSLRTLYNRLITFLIRNGLWAEINLADQKTRYLADRNLLGFIIKQAITRVLGRSKVFHAFIRLLARGWNVPSETGDLFVEVNPSLVWSTDILDEMDFDIMSLARKNSVPIVSMVRSWDNLRILTPMLPDQLMVWNSFLKEIAVGSQGYDPNKITIVGTPQYDLFLTASGALSREEFMAQFNLPRDNKLIVVAGIGNFLAPHEGDIAAILSKAIEDGKLPSTYSVLFRPHPHFLVDKETIEKLPHVIFDNNVARYLSQKVSSWEMDLNKTAHLINTLKHADVVITTASTITIDACVFDRPVICIAFDGYAKEPYARSVRRFYEVFTHYIAIDKLGGYKRAYSAEDLIAEIKAYVQNPKEDFEGREKIRKEFAGPLGGARERIAALLLAYRK